MPPCCPDERCRTVTMRKTNGCRLLAVALVLRTALAVTPTQAHELQGDVTGGLLAGFVHPIAGLDHVVALVTVGLLGAQLGRPAIFLLPITFPIVMALGGVLGAMRVPFPGIETGIAASALVLGAMIALAVRAPLAVTATIVGGSRSSTVTRTVRSFLPPRMPYRMHSVSWSRRVFCTRSAFSSARSVHGVGGRKRCVQRVPPARSSAFTT